MLETCNLCRILFLNAKIKTKDPTWWQIDDSGFHWSTSEKMYLHSDSRNTFCILGSTVSDFNLVCVLVIKLLPLLASLLRTQNSEKQLYDSEIMYFLLKFSGLGI